MATTPQQPVQQQPTQTGQYEESAPWQEVQEEQFASEQLPQQPTYDSISWSSVEYIEHEKSPAWYGMFAGATISTALIIYLLTKELLASVAITVVGGSASFFASRPPATRTYTLTPEAIKVNEKEYSLEGFQSFSVVEEGSKDSIWLKPTKRFAPMLMIYFEPKDEQQIITALGSLLPHEERELDNLDKLTRKLKF